MVNQEGALLQSDRPVLPNVADCEAGKRSTFTVRVPVEYKEMKQPNP